MTEMDVRFAIAIAAILVCCMAVYLSERLAKAFRRDVKALKRELTGSSRKKMAR